MSLEYVCSGAEPLCVAPLDDFMASDETFSSVKALQEATAKDVQQRIATVHLRPLLSFAGLSRPQGIHPGKAHCMYESAYAAFALLEICIL